MIVEQPHFDSERTILKARRVVPLRTIDPRLKHLRYWFLGGAFVIAMVLGAMSALVAAYVKIRNVPDPEIQSLSVAPGPEETPPQTPVVQVISPRPRRKPTTESLDRATAESVTPPAPTTQPGLSEKDELQQIRDAVLVDQWEERRARRVERQDRPDRRRAQHHGRDASNINEIFEGPHHP